jgi:hypothetical protein
MRFALLVSSYSLLFGLLSLRYAGRPPLALAFYAAFAFGVLVTGWLLLGERRKQPFNATFTTVVDQGSATSAYLVTYLLPLIGDDPSDREIVAHVIFLFVLVVVTFQANLELINPLLYLFGWQIFRVTTSAGTLRYLVARDAPVPNAPLRVTRLTTDILVQRRN